MATEDILDAEEGRYYCYINVDFFFIVEVSSGYCILTGHL